MTQSLSKKRQFEPKSRTRLAAQNEQRQPRDASRQNANDLDLHTKRKIERPLPEILQNDPILGSKQVAAALNISAVHLRRLARAGRIAAPLKIGYRKLGWRLATIVKMRADHEVEARDETS